jgi:hypothetical protein
VPKSAIANQLLDNWSNLVLTPSLELSSQVKPGSQVRIWSAPLLDYRSYGPPVLLALEAEVVAIFEPSGNFANQRRSVELRVPNESLEFLLMAVANADSIALTSIQHELN